MTKEILIKIDQINRSANYLKKLIKMDNSLDEYTTIKAFNKEGDEIELLGMADEAFNILLEDVIPKEIAKVESGLRQMVISDQ